MNGTAIHVSLLSSKELNITSSPNFSYGEVTAYCPGCKNMQTIQIVGDKLVRTRKFSQEGSRIYHDCGSNRPVMLLGRVIGLRS